MANDAVPTRSLTTRWILTLRDKLLVHHVREESPTRWRVDSGEIVKASGRFATERTDIARWKKNWLYRTGHYVPNRVPENYQELMADPDLCAAMDDHFAAVDRCQVLREQLREAERQQLASAERRDAALERLLPLARPRA